MAPAYYNEQESKTYVTGKPCKRGHMAPRYKSTRTCVACAAERCVEWQSANRRKYLDAQNEARRVRLFGLPMEKYRELLAAQSGGCAICGRDNGKRMLAVDHDHSCCNSERTCGKCVRGLLCDQCNHGLGKFRDSPELLRRAAEYVCK